MTHSCSIFPSSAGIPSLGEVNSMRAHVPSATVMQTNNTEGGSLICKCWIMLVCWHFQPFFLGLIVQPFPKLATRRRTVMAQECNKQAQTETQFALKSEIHILLQAPLSYSLIEGKETQSCLEQCGASSVTPMLFSINNLKSAARLHYAAFFSFLF